MGGGGGGGILRSISYNDLGDPIEVQYYVRSLKPNPM